jgi:sirohydrochlorin cobaltochelatase
MKALIFFGHGARDVRWREPFDCLKRMWQEEFPDIPVELAFLELMQPSLVMAIGLCRDQGANNIQIVPVFFGQGGHLREDFPRLLQDARAQFPDLHLSASPAVGESKAVLQAIIQFSAGTLSQGLTD